jgi:hypothetical protein
MTSPFAPCLLWIKRDWGEPTAGSAMSAVPRLRPRFEVQQNFVMCQKPNCHVEASFVVEFDR